MDRQDLYQYWDGLSPYIILNGLVKTPPLRAWPMSDTRQRMIECLHLLALTIVNPQFTMISLSDTPGRNICASIYSHRFVGKFRACSKFKRLLRWERYGNVTNCLFFAIQKNAEYLFLSCQNLLLTEKDKCHRYILVTTHKRTRTITVEYSVKRRWN